MEPLVFEIANNFTQEFALPPRGSILLYDYISPTTTANDAFIYIYGDDTWKKIAKHSIISENNVLFKLFKFNIPGLSGDLLHMMTECLNHRFQNQSSHRIFFRLPVQSASDMHAYLTTMEIFFFEINDLQEKLLHKYAIDIPTVSILNAVQDSIVDVIFQFDSKGDLYSREAEFCFNIIQSEDSINFDLMRFKHSSEPTYKYFNTIGRVLIEPRILSGDACINTGMQITKTKMRL